MRTRKSNTPEEKFKLAIEKRNERMYRESIQHAQSKYTRALERAKQKYYDAYNKASIDLFYSCKDARELYPHAKIEAKE